MECPYCLHELAEDDNGTINKKRVHVYRCPNFEGFDNESDAIEDLILQKHPIGFLFKHIHPNTFKNFIAKEFLNYTEELEYQSCDSYYFNGFFHTIEGDSNLHEGYPF